MSLKAFPQSITIEPSGFAATNMSVVLEGQVLQNSNVGAVNPQSVANGDLGMVTGIQSKTLTLNSNVLWRSINNLNKAYYITVRSDAWSDNMGIYGLKITYTY